LLKISIAMTRKKTWAGETKKEAIKLNLWNLFFKMILQNKNICTLISNHIEESVIKMWRLCIYLDHLSILEINSCLKRKNIFNLQGSAKYELNIKILPWC
jgi:hypothetical protein